MRCLSIVTVGGKRAGTAYTLNAGAAVLVLFILLLILLIAGFGNALYRSYEGFYFYSFYTVHKMENAYLHKKFTELENSINRTEKLINKKFVFEDKIRAVYGMIPVDTDERQVGIGGSLPLEQPAGKEINDKMGRLREKTDLLGRQVGYQIFQFNKIKEKISFFNRELARMPTVWPSIGRITSPFGFRIHPITGYASIHKGIDIAAPADDPVIAPADGIVFYRGNAGPLGNLLIIDHSDKCRTYYAHLGDTFVKKGCTVRRGDLIGYVGKTGRTTGTHLHYEVMINQKQVNPVDFILPTAYAVD